MARAQKWVGTVMLFVVVALAVAVGSAGTANAATPQAVTSLTAGQKGAPQDCGGVILAGAAGNAVGWAAAAFFAESCGAWVGDEFAKSICWQSRQPWGVLARAEVWAMTRGKHDTC